MNEFECRWFGKLGNFLRKTFFLCLAKNFFAPSKKKSKSLLKNEVPRDWWFGKVSKKVGKKTLN